MPDRIVVYVDEAPTFRITDGMVHVEDADGGRRVMSIHNFRKSIGRAERCLREWQDAQGRPIPFRKRGHHAAS